MDMTTFDKIKKYYDTGLYKNSHLITLVQFGHLTTDQYAEIVGESFPENVSTERVPSVIEEIKEETKTLNAKVQALTESNQFLEDCIVEMAEIVYA